METRLVRENRKMRTLTLAAAALLVVLAGSGIADAAILTLSISITDNTLNIGESTTYTVYGKVTDNTYTDPYAFVFDGGIATYMVDEVFTSSNGGLIRHMQGAGPPTTTTSNTLAINPPFTASTAGKIKNAAWVDTALGTGGVNNVYGGQSTGGGYDYYTGGRFLYGNGEAAALFTGTFIAVTNGTVNIALNREPGTCLVWALGGATGETLVSKIVETVVPGSGQIIVGPVTTNTAPTVDIPGGDVHEEDWSKEPGWNNPLHKVVITAVGTDDGKPIPPGALSYVWTMSKPGGDSKLLAENGKVLTLTIAEIASLGLPGPYNTPPGPDPGVYMWDLSVKAYDGELYSPLDGIKVFVPEPATIGLLSFGIVGALLRRRRRA